MTTGAMLIGAAAALGIAGAAFVGLRRLWDAAVLRLFRPPRLVRPLPDWLDAVVEDVGIPAEGSTMRGWLLWPRETAAGIVAVIHGWGGDSGRMGVVAAPLLRARLTCLVVDVRGHGRSRPEATYNAVRLLEDIIAVRDWIGREPRLAALPAALAGYSFGGLGALLAAVRDPRWQRVAAIAAPRGAMEATQLFLAQRGLPVRILSGPLRRSFRRTLGIDPADHSAAEALRDSRVPTLIVHGLRDEVVPPEHGRDLAASVPERYRETFWVETAGHFDVLDDPAVADRLHEFFTRDLQ